MTDQEIRLKFGEMNAGEMRLARSLVGWHERELAKLKEELAHAERWRDKLDTKLTEVVEAAERAGWDDVENSKNLPTFITYLAEALSKAQAELAALRQSTQSAQPILADDGRSLGQVACECYHEAYGVGTVEKWQRAAQAVVAAARPAIEAEFLAQAQQAAAQPWTPAVGDVVRLKSGGPAMTVTGVDPLSLMCAWMNADDELQVEPITTLCLEPAKP